MIPGRPQQGLLIVLASLAACTGCERSAPSSQPTKPARSALTHIAPEAAGWSLEEACTKLEDPVLGLSAAVRLSWLSDETPLCVPRGLGDDVFDRLRLMSTDEGLWALGIASGSNPHELRAPVLIGADGKVRILSRGVSEELLTLHIADDPDVFPHLLLLPHRVLILDGNEISTAIVLAPGERQVRFELRHQKGFPYVSLRLHRHGADNEVARYLWDPYELAFMGPAVDVLPDPPGGKFHIDLEASVGLVPVGGELPEPKPIEQVPPDEPEDMMWDDGLLPA